MSDHTEEIRGNSSYHTNDERIADIAMYQDMMFGVRGSDSRSIARGMERVSRSGMNTHGYYEY